MESKVLGRVSTAVFATALMTAQAYGSSGPDGREGGRRPPQEAFDACSGKSEGTVVEMTTPRGGVMKAVCKAVNGVLVAVPQRRPEGPADRTGDRGEPGKGEPAEAQ